MNYGMTTTPAVTREQSRMVSDLQVFRRAVEHNPNQEFRVAAYCRVSTNLKVQESSLETQMASFNQRIAEHPGWTLVGIYADKGLTGTTAKGRVEFQRLIQDAADGKIDYIMAKSISRFARNTVDALSYTRKLKEMGVGVYFEEQSLDTLSATSEIMLTIHAAFAQEESHSFSENMKSGMRNRFALGIPKWSETYGFRCEGTDWYIHEEEAAVIREIYRLYVNGWSLPMIGDELERREIKPPKGCIKGNDKGYKDTWWEHTLATILHSEKYIGDAEMQKSYTVDCLTRKRVSNENADIPKYYKKGHHERIVDDETWHLAQVITVLKDRHRGAIQYPFFGFLKCPFCGENMLSLRLPTRNVERAWFCSEKCKLYVVKDKYLHSAIMEAYEQTGRTIPRKRIAQGNTSLSQMEMAQTDKTPLGQTVEYKFLYDNVESITFQKKGKKVDWNTLVVTWKWGETTTGGISYQTPSDIPCTKLEQKDGWVYINGEKQTRVKHAAVCVERVTEFVRDTFICDDEKSSGDNGLNIPIVLSPKSVKG